MQVSEEVADALAGGRAVVALESTLLVHGLPAGRNLDVAQRLERAVRGAGAVPATVAVVDGQAVVGMSSTELYVLCTRGDVPKLSLRDLGPAVGLGRSGATTVASTAALAHAAGIGVFATGGLGGVHLPTGDSPTTWDVSADIGVLATTPVLVVCSGVKSVLDIAATLELLETQSVPVLGYCTDDFPAFYLRSSGHPVPLRVDDPAAAADVVRAHRSVAGSGVVLANPVPVESEMDRGLHDRLLAEAMELLRGQNVRGSDVTPVLLEHFHTASDGASVDVNEALVLANATVAAQVAVELAR